MRTTQVLVIIICIIAIIGLTQKPAPTKMNVVNPTTSQSSTQPSSGIGDALSITQ